ncbi:MAG: putative rane protein [Gemmatimonadetes bacterium]|jgi:uncharacterized protein (DUF983 family)|nr:putative rane protein [Gemmatimonadota bacterium]
MRPAGATPAATLGQRVRWAMLRRCPRCGAGGMWGSWLRMHEACASCGQVFERGESSDFWVGAYLINLVVAELAAVLLGAVMWLTAGRRVPFNVLWGASMALAILMPIVFYPFSRTLWLAFDLHFRPSERGDEMRN